MSSKAPNLCSLVLFNPTDSGDVLIYISSFYLPTDPRYLPLLLRYFIPLVHWTFARPPIPNLGFGDHGTNFPFTQAQCPSVSCFSIFPTVNPDMKPHPFFLWTLFCTLLSLSFQLPPLRSQLWQSPRRSHRLQPHHPNHLPTTIKIMSRKHRLSQVVTPSAFSHSVLTPWPPRVSPNGLS